MGPTGMLHAWQIRFRLSSARSRPDDSGRVAADLTTQEVFQQ
jgi:hypothetical protein